RTAKAPRREMTLTASRSRCPVPFDGVATWRAGTAAARIRRVISAAGSDTDARRTDSAGAGSKTATAAAPAEGRARGSGERQEVRTSTSRGGVAGLNVVKEGRLGAGAGGGAVRENAP